jgi:peptidoglycan L-alanyl-D-glutamate endopeptidase CwlK
MSDRNLSDLVPSVQTAAEAALAECAAKGLDVLVTCTYRSPADQNALYAQGRTAPGAIVTNARAGQSMHQYRCALDIVPMRYGKCVWNGSDPVWQQIAAVFKAHGFEWGEDWVSFKEMPHFQITGGHPLSYFQGGGTL